MYDEYYLVEGHEDEDYFVPTEEATPEEIEATCAICGDNDRIIGTFDNIADGIDLIHGCHYSPEYEREMLNRLHKLDLPEY